MNHTSPAPKSQLAYFKYQTEMHTIVCQKTDKDALSTIIHNSPEIEVIQMSINARIKK